METNGSGTLSGVSLHYDYDPFPRRTDVSVPTNGPFALRHTSYFFDTTSNRLTNVSDGTCAAAEESQRKIDALRSRGQGWRRS